ncbi:MAG: pectinesterase family protein [Clostridia bacterium]|nr:pectinesterase family protein [Clostridia bacterium]
MIVTVDMNGNGDHVTLQAAVDMIAPGEHEPNVIRVMPGIYREKVVVDKDNIIIAGAGCDDTVLVWNGCAMDPDENGRPKGTFLSYTLLITGRNVTVENITVSNDAGDGREVGQAIAVYASGDRGVFRNVRMTAHQDTLYCGPVNEPVCRDALPRRIFPQTDRLNLGDSPETYGRLYFENCLIAGDVDFIFGSYRCWFEACTLFMNRRGGWYTAANTPERQKYGFVFSHCVLTGECEAGTGSLGRPWRAFARTVFLNCRMDEHVSPRGFSDWQGGAAVTERYGEYGTTGPGACTAGRHPAQKRLTAEEAEQITVHEVLSGYDEWDPDMKKTP